VTEQTYLFLAHVPLAGVDDYRQFVARVMPLIDASGGRLERSVASDDGTVELFIVSFPDNDCYEQLATSTHIDDAAPLLYRSGARFEVLTLAHNPTAPMG
jgi:hypothetical protein